MQHRWGAEKCRNSKTYENKGVTTLSPLGASAWVTIADLRDSGTDYSESLATPANANATEMHVQMTTQLSVEIQAAIGKWATHLRTLPWPLRRHAIKRFVGSFVDNALANILRLSNEEYENLPDIGTTASSNNWITAPNARHLSGDGPGLSREQSA